MRRPPRKKMFTEFFIKHLKAEKAPYLVWDTKQSGFAVRVEPTGYQELESGLQVRWSKM